jgi:tRNA G10  N-methylase Trm11
MGLPFGAPMLRAVPEAHPSPETRPITRPGQKPLALLYANVSRAKRGSVKLVDPF